MASWYRLNEVIEATHGHFTIRDAEDVGFSKQLVRHHVKSGVIRRVHRGIYRLRSWRRSFLDDLVPIWLWTERRGVFSHVTALALQGELPHFQGHVDIYVRSLRRRDDSKAPPLAFLRMPPWTAPPPPPVLVHGLPVVPAWYARVQSIAAAATPLAWRGSAALRHS